MKILNMIFFVIFIFFNAHLLVSMDDNIDVEIAKHEKELVKVEKSREIMYPLISFLYNHGILRVPFEHKESAFDCLLIDVDATNEANKFSTAALHTWQFPKNFNKNTGVQLEFDESVRTIVLPFEVVAKNTKLEGATASQLKVYTLKDKMYLAVRNDTYNKEAIFACISVKAKNQNQANL